MKRSFVLFVVSLLVFSCGKNKNEETNEIEKIKEDKYSITMDAIYEKDDSIVAFYKAGGFILYEKPISVKVKGSALIQRIIFDIPSGTSATNFSILASSNKLQDHLTVKNISIKRNDSLVIDGDNFKYSEYFLADQSFTWDPKLLRCNLTHTNKYPPSFVGNEKVETILVK